MRKQFFFLLPALIWFSSLLAQEEMPIVWEIKGEHKMENTGLADARGYVFGSDDKEGTVMNSKDGSTVWTGKFKEIAPGLSKVDEQICMWEANVLFVFDRKMGKDKIACIDITTGKFLWMSDKYQDLTDENIIYIPELEAFAVSTKTTLFMLKARTGEEMWQTMKFKGVVGAYVYMSDGNLVMLNYKPTALAALFAGFKNQIVKINTKNGDVVWDQTFVGLAERKVITKEPLARIKVLGGKVFLYLNGIQVYDYETGAQQWSAAFDADINVVKAPMGARKFGVYGVVADPVIVGNDVYVIDMQNKAKQFVKKYDLNSGKLLWTSPEIKEAKALPGLYVADNTVILQVGGVVECQAYIYQRTRQPDGSYIIVEQWKVYYRNVKPNGLQAFDATNGSALWDSERFKKGITNAFVSGSNVIVCSGKELYSIGIKSGKEAYGVALEADGIGLAQKIIDYKDKVVVVGEKGVSGHDKSDGKLQASSKWKSAEYSGMYENTLMMTTEKDDVAAYDLETMKYKQYNARKDAVSKLSEDGRFVYVWDKKNVVKLGTR